MQIWIVTRDGSEWADIKSAHRAPETAHERRDNLERANRGSTDVFERLSEYTVREVTLED